MKRPRGKQIDRASMRVALAAMLYERGAGESAPATIGQRLAHVRICAGVDQGTMAAYFGVVLRTWVNYERGAHAPNARTLVELWRLGISPAWVLTGTGAVLVDDATPEVSDPTQANEWGSAGECPASFSAKTPAAGAWCFRVAGVGTWHGDGTISLCVNLQRPGGGVE